MAKFGCRTVNEPYNLYNTTGQITYNEDNTKLQCETSLVSLSDRYWRLTTNAVPDHEAHCGSTPNNIENQNLVQRIPKDVTYVEDVSSNDQQLPQGSIAYRVVFLKWKF